MFSEDLISFSCELKTRTQRFALLLWLLMFCQRGQKRTIIILNKQNLFLARSKSETAVAHVKKGKKKHMYNELSHYGICQSFKTDLLLVFLKQSFFVYTQYVRRNASNYGKSFCTIKIFVIKKFVS